MTATRSIKEILTAKDVAALLGVHIRTVQRKTTIGVFKSYPFEGKHYYKYSEIEKQIFGASEQSQTEKEQNEESQTDYQ